MFLSLFQQGKDLKKIVNTILENSKQIERFLSLFQQGKDLKGIQSLKDILQNISVSIPFSAGQRLKDKRMSKMKKKVMKTMVSIPFSAGQRLKEAVWWVGMKAL
mgnify:CR=1 FL=1